MNASLASIDLMLSRAVAVAQAGDEALRDALEALPAAIYLTDADGFVTYFNRACIGFTGRMPELGHDRWCVTWRLHTLEGEPLPHDQCPMAVAIRTGRPVRGVRASAERPDGSRVTFQPYPTPLFDPAGRLAGAVNILIDVTDELQVEVLRVQASRCRRLAFAVDDRRTGETLTAMADEYEAKADALRGVHERQRPLSPRPGARASL